MESGSPTAVDLDLSGMHCQSCVLLIQETLDGDPAILSASVDLDSAKARVTFEPGTTSAEAICTTITDLGYPAQLAGQPSS